jgi:hypothetical protein
LTKNSISIACHKGIKKIPDKKRNQPKDPAYLPDSTEISQYSEDGTGLGVLPARRNIDNAFQFGDLLRGHLTGILSLQRCKLEGTFGISFQYKINPGIAEATYAIE